MIEDQAGQKYDTLSWGSVGPSGTFPEGCKATFMFRSWNVPVECPS